MILESIVTSVSGQGRINIAPMGPRVETNQSGETSFVLRPFDTSTTYQNLVDTGSAVIHVTDDTELFARAAVDAIGPTDVCELVEQIEGTNLWPLRDCHRWFGVEVESISEDSPRIDIRCRVIQTKVLRPFFGFNRAKHAVIEAAILATRTHLLPRDQIVETLSRLQSWVDKTGGPAETRAFEFLRKTIDERFERG